MRRVISAVLIGVPLLWACGDGAGPDNTITVSGTVLDMGARPLAGAKVLVTGLAPVTADADGHFSISGVKTPYQIAAAVTTTPAAAVYDGLTSDTLELVIPVGSIFATLPRQATLSGTVLGGAGYPQPAGYKSILIFESPETAWRTALFDKSTGAYQMAPKWAGPATTIGTVHALQWQFDSLTVLPTAYTGYGVRTGVSLTDGGTVAGQDVQLGPVTTGSLSGTVTLPAGYTMMGKILSVVFATSRAAQWTLFTDVSTATEFTYLTPSLPGTTFSLEVDAVAGDAAAVAVKTGMSASGSGISLVVPAAPVLAGLDDGATGVVAGTRVSWSRMSQAIYLLGITPSTAQAPQYYVFTSDTTAMIPNLSSLGLGLPSATAYDWVVAGMARFTSAELVALVGMTPQGDWSTARSATRHFTTAP